jgi:adenine-specific DNA-methyltransferase
MPGDVRPEGDIRKGFLYKRVPHVTLRAIANNSEIDSIHTKWQEYLEPVRTELNKVLSQGWDDWEIPRTAEVGWPNEAKQLLEDWWRLRCERQKEMDASIARRADTELLYDQPYEDNRRVRVTGPFTVESLSPHRIVSFEDDDQPEAEAKGHEVDDAQRFVTTILDNLRRAGVQNTKKGERIQFDRLDPYPNGTLVQGYGEYTEQNGTVRRAAVCIGPRYGTVGRDLIRDAVIEVGNDISFDLLLMCGFAFDAYSAEVRRMGRLLVLPVKMNPDLSIGGDLLKKTSAANLFMVFGEPDVTVGRNAQDKLVVEVHGVDIYNPTTGEMRSSSTDDIACWFIDTNYNAESFFVCHAYFTGADQPYEKLKRALRADIDEAAWAAVYSTKSRPFDPPESGKIAVKVINHYGDEVLKVYSV